MVVELRQSSTTLRICTMGAGAVGTIVSAVIATKVQASTVTVVDIDQERIASWSSGPCPVYEPGLKDILDAVQKTSGGQEQKAVQNNGDHAQSPHMCAKSPNLRFSIDIKTAIADADMILLAVDTPQVSTQDLRVCDVFQMATCSPGLDLRSLAAAVRMIAENAEGYTNVVLKSTVPCSTTEKISRFLNTNHKPNATFSVLHNPELLAQGSAVQNFLSPNAVIIGSDSADNNAADSLRSLYLHWVPECKIHKMSLVSAELAKLACNTLRAQNVSVANVFNLLCESTGANIEHVLNACSKQSGIDYSGFRPGLGFGGRCLEKDVRCLANIADCSRLGAVATYLNATTTLNDFVLQKRVETIEEWFGGKLDGLNIAVLGFAFKRGTRDIRHSRVINVAHELMERGAVIRAYDPHIDYQSITHALSNPNKNFGLVLCSNAYEACAQADLVFMGTDEEEFDGLDWERISDGLKAPKRFVEGRGNQMRMSYMRTLGMEVK